MARPKDLCSAMTSTVQIQDSQVSIHTTCSDDIELPVTNSNYQNKNSELELNLHLEEPVELSTLDERDVFTQSADPTVSKIPTPVTATIATQSADSILTVIHTPVVIRKQPQKCNCNGCRTPDYQSCKNCMDMKK